MENSSVAQIPWSVVMPLVGVIVGSLIPLSYELVKNKLQKKKRAVHLAIVVSVELDRFYKNCISFLKDDGTHHGFPISTFEPTVSPPILSLSALDVDWSSIEPGIMDEIIHFPLEIEIKNKRILAIKEISGPPDYSEYYDDRNELYPDIALKALALSKKLRKQNGLPLTCVQKNSDYIETCNIIIEKVDKKRKKQE